MQLLSVCESGNPGTYAWGPTGRAKLSGNELTIPDGKLPEEALRALLKLGAKSVQWRVRKPVVGQAQALAEFSGERVVFQTRSQLTPEFLSALGSPPWMLALRSGASRPEELGVFAHFGGDRLDVNVVVTPEMARHLLKWRGKHLTIRHWRPNHPDNPNAIARVLRRGRWRTLSLPSEPNGTPKEVTAAFVKVLCKGKMTVIVRGKPACKRRR